MITAKSTGPKYQVSFTDGLHECVSDASEDKGGCSSGFRPHDLLEAALATCLNIWLSIYADNHDIPVSDIQTTVSLDRSRPNEVIFNFSITISGALSSSEKQKLVSVAKTCPIHKTLTKKLTLKSVQQVQP
jgi:putative redox protein